MNQSPDQNSEAREHLGPQSQGNPSLEYTGADLTTSAEKLTPAEGPVHHLPWYQTQASVAAPSAFMARAWQVGTGCLPQSRLVPQRGFLGWWEALPLPNQLLFCVWTAWVGWVGIKLSVPPLQSAVQEAVFPYTGEGKRQTCLSNLRAIYEATALYTKDSDGHFPPLDMPRGAGNSAPRRTWVSALQGYAPQSAFQCPRASGIPNTTPLLSGSYVMNPVLGGASPTAVDNPARTVLLADGGEQHDVSLLPPYPSWPSSSRKALSGSDTSTSDIQTPEGVSQPALDLGSLNFAFRHNLGSGAGAVATLYADGHADSPSFTDLQQQTAGRAIWGGSAVMRLSLARLSLARLGAGSMVRSEFVGDLKAGDVAGAASDLRSHRQALAPLSNNLLALWKLNDPTASNGSKESDASDLVDRLGWNLSLAQKQAGQPTFEGELNREMALRSEIAFQSAESAGGQDQSGEPGWTIEIPRNWTREERETGRYHQTVFHSTLKDVSIVVEVGQNTTYHAPRPVDWSGMEKGLRSKAGSGYRRIIWETGALAGWPANVWDYEVNKPGSPRLRKLTVGHSGESYSYIVVCTAPAAQFEKWRPMFERAFGTFLLP